MEFLIKLWKHLVLGNFEFELFIKFDQFFLQKLLKHLFEIIIFLITHVKIHFICFVVCFIYQCQP